jgi:MarR family 2-MHQ and catechol resistance regulon transcriptional repressor
VGTHYKGTRSEERSLDVFIKLMRCANSVMSRVGQRINEAGLTTSQFGALEALYHLGPLSQCDIAGKMLCSESNITFVLDKLEERGWIRRDRSESDRRVIVVSLTAAGRKFIAGVFPDIASVIEQEMNVLTVPELQSLGDTCRKLGTQNG